MAFRSLGAVGFRTDGRTRRRISFIFLFSERTPKIATGRGFDSRWYLWNFSVTQSFRSHYCPGVDSASNRNEYQEYFLRGKGGRCVGLTTLPLSCADCLEIWELQLSGNLRAGPVLTKKTMYLDYKHQLFNVG